MKVQLLSVAALVLLNAVSGVQSAEESPSEFSSIKKALRGIASASTIQAAGVINEEESEAAEMEDHTQVEDDTKIEYGDIFNEEDEASGDSCGQSCHKDSNCYHGGYVTCGTCNLLHGTRDYKMCIKADTPSPTPPPFQSGSCGNDCKHDSDCQHGGYNSCAKCGQYEGAQYYRQCYAGDSEE